MSDAAHRSATRYLAACLYGAAAAFAVRWIFADLPTALAGAAEVAVIFGIVLLLARACNWQDAPVLYAAIAAIAVTIAFLITGPLA